MKLHPIFHTKVFLGQDSRYAFSRIFIQDGYVYATDGQGAIRQAIKGFPPPDIQPVENQPKMNVLPWDDPRRTEKVELTANDFCKICTPRQRYCSSCRGSVSLAAGRLVLHRRHAVAIYAHFGAATIFYNPETSIYRFEGEHKFRDGEIARIEGLIAKNMN